MRQQVAANPSRVVGRLTLLFTSYLLDFRRVDPLATRHAESACLAVSLQDILAGAIFNL